jgi:DNA-binding response OmpR family regulator
MPTNQQKVLLVEDEKMLAEMYATKFSMEGYTVEKAFDGAQGLELAKTMNPDIILLDVIMPKLDGFATLKQLKADPKLKAIPVIMLTNLGQEDDLKKGKELGATDYFVKSNHSPSEIVDKVKVVLKS